jgi:hypothetical protein
MLTVTPCIKTLVLCQPGSQGTLAFSSRRRRGDPLYLGRAVTTSPQTRGRSLSWGVWTWSAPPRNPILLRRSAYLNVAPLVTVCDTHVSRARPAPHHAGLSPRRPRAGPHTSGLGGAPPQAVVPCSTCHSGEEWCEACPARPPPACVRHGMPRARRYGIRG